ncbi:UNVERIFIED_CONTAM: hypothetical protein NCL1_17561 [Trichonephila clavipes]
MFLVSGKGSLNREIRKLDDRTMKERQRSVSASQKKNLSRTDSNLVGDNNQGAVSLLPETPEVRVYNVLFLFACRRRA